MNRTLAALMISAAALLIFYEAVRQMIAHTIAETKDKE